MGNHAFLIIAHHQPKLLARMLEVLEKENHFFFIHINVRSGDLQPFIDATKDIKNVCFVDRVKIYHGEISEIWASLILMKTAIDSGVEFSFFHQLSGQDYPLRSNEQFDEFFETKTDSYMLYEDFDNWPEPHKKRHYNRIMHYRPKFDDNKLKKTIYYGLRIPQLISIISKRPDVDNFSIGSAFYSFHKRVVEFILNYNLQHPDFLCRFVYTSSPSEFFFHTMLKPYISEMNIHTDEPLRYFSFVPHRPINTKYRPFILNEMDYEYVIDSRAFFCRKVDEKQSAKLLDMIDSQRGSFYDINDHTSIY